MYEVHTAELLHQQRSAELARTAELIRSQSERRWLTIRPARRRPVRRRLSVLFGLLRSVHRRSATA